MSALIFNNPFPSGLVYVISSKRKSGASTVASLAQTDGNIVQDIGVVADPEGLCNSVSDIEVQFLYVHKDEVEAPDWVNQLAEIKPVIHVNYNSLIYSDLDWELMKTNHELLLELEKLLPEESLIRAKRDEIRTRFSD
ncbi:hypothetical protein N7I40_004018 [Vibrio parahaemolyticus]|uniref:hypothetical protein n=1 Tax=Vibrio harveyi group TaxID=717610 RepID=UPI00063DBF2C|nr:MULTISPECIES: hypothetical protein [Vibrio harveyi group]EGR3221648.1 hypothetical protein [Vibrio parahaemolyticus]EHK6545761.1 hypothetical protein [Vibrio parahaemolyticus]EJV5946392.1 hypothetical protein [Vibrio parahaemolyticus]EKN4564893.1 hypothetical protein [Vibrio parahaemolyticus]ELA7322631.1 hypothetical protein [Vibrio parahaemolyticus]